MGTKELDSAAVRSGRELSERVLKQRTSALRKRATVLAKDKGAALAVGLDIARAAPEDLLRFNAATRGLLLGIGDSWFDYFSMDVLDSLQNDLGYTRTSMAVAGTSLAAIAENPVQLRDLSSEIEKTVGGTPPKAILVSGGGNDFVDFGLKNLLNDYGSPQPLKPQLVDQLVDTDIKTALKTVLDAINDVCNHWLKKTLPILIHGYDHPIPDGRYLHFPPRGPWLEPDFLAMHYPESALKERSDVMATLIDRLNGMQITLAKSYTNVTHVELRGTLDDPTDYTNTWSNELHPTYEGFQALAQKFDTELQKLP